MQTGKITALYARFSHDENNTGRDSNSIAHQKELLAEYANSHGFVNHRFYVDDGFSGVSFQRPAFQQLVSDIENGLIGTLIVKDMSRLGRNYLMVGQYTEIIFPEYNVRFIAISDNVDSAEGLSDLIPFSNLINEWYAKDISKKMRSMISQKGNSGKRLTTKVIYGYKKAPEDKSKWIIDEYAAAVVRRIYDMYINGKGAYIIAHILQEEKILAPRAYQYPNSTNTPYAWSGATVTLILTKREYCGDTVNFRMHRVSYKNKKIVRNPPEMQKIFLNTHPAIIDRETYDKAQRRYAQRCRKKRDDKFNALFTGYLFCKECKSKFHVFRHMYHGEMLVSYECSGYRKQQNNCTYHRIDESVLQQYVLEQIRLLWYEAKADMQSFKEKIRKKINADESISKNQIRKDIDSAQQRISEIDKYVQDLFEARVRGEINSDMFGSLSKTYTEEKSELNAKVAELILKESKAKDINCKVNVLFNAIEKYDSISDLTSEILRDFIDHIEVGKCDKSIPKAKRKQEIDVYFIGIGLMNFL